jgi:ABC-type branched-subunit amino acid transport system permease subunit
VLVCIGLNIVTGYAGLLSLGPTALFAVGGYTAALLANHFPAYVNIAFMVLAGTATAGLAGLLIAIPTLRVSGFYLAMGTLFVSILIPQVAPTGASPGPTSGSR